MTDFGTDRLWPPSSLTRSELEQARLAYERTPLILETLTAAALAHCDDKLALVEGVLRGVRT